MGRLTEIRTLKTHNGDEIRVERDGNIVKVFKNGGRVLTFGEAEWNELTRP